MVYLEVRGRRQLQALDRALKGVDKQLKRDTYRALNRTVKPLTAAVKDSTGDFVPSAYAAELSSSLRIRAQRRGGQMAALTLKATAKSASGKPRELRRVESGRLRHPLWGNRRHWFDQSVKPGFWTKPLEKEAPAVRKELVKVMDDLVLKIAKSV